MVKMKTNKSAAKRFRRTKSGKIKRSQAFSTHYFTAKTRKRKRHLRKGALVADVNQPRIQQLVPYI